MLMVETYLDRSSVHGIGLFAGRAIAQGEVVWQFHPGVDLLFEEGQWRLLLESVSQGCGRSLRNYSYKEKGLYCVCLDNGKFMNHSPALANIRQSLQENVMWASRDIRQGEELLCNYHHYSDEDDMHHLKLLEREALLAQEGLSREMTQNSGQGEVHPN